MVKDSRKQTITETELVQHKTYVNQNDDDEENVSNVTK